MEVVCNANLPRPERLVSLQAEKTVGKIFTERPSGSGASVPPAVSEGSGSRIAREAFESFTWWQYPRRQKGEERPLPPRWMISR